MAYDISLISAEILDILGNVEENYQILGLRLIIGCNILVQYIKKLL